MYDQCMTICRQYNPLVDQNTSISYVNVAKSSSFSVEKHEYMPTATFESLLDFHCQLSYQQPYIWK